MRKLTHNLKIKAKKRMKNCGFTMVELIVVVAILGVLAAILIPTLLGITIRATVGSANTTAAELKKQIGYFLTMADANRKNYMLMGEDCREVFTISVVDGTWYIDAAQNPSAFSPDTVTWGNAATVTQATNTVNSQYGEELLGMYLRDVFPTISSGVIRANCIKGVCVSVWYTPDTTNISDINDVPAFGTSKAWVDDNGDEITKYRWDGTTAGVSTDGYTIGTAPALDIGA